MHSQKVSKQPAPPATGVVRRPFKLDQRLPPDVIEQLVAEYEAGDSAKAVAERFGIGKGSAVRLLTERGVMRPRRLPTEEKVAEGARLYATGLSLQASGDQVGLDPTTLLREFRKLDIATRRPWERP